MSNNPNRRRFITIDLDDANEPEITINPDQITHVARLADGGIEIHFVGGGKLGLQASEAHPMGDIYNEILDALNQ